MKVAICISFFMNKTHYLQSSYKIHTTWEALAIVIDKTKNMHNYAMIFYFFLNVYNWTEKRLNSYFIYFKECGTALKEASPDAARETLPIVAAKRKSTAQCGTVLVPPITGLPKNKQVVVN